MSQGDAPPTTIEPALLAALTALALGAGARILAERRIGAAVREKADRSPVTAADEAAEATILDGLARLLPGVPVVSEERGTAGWVQAGGATFALVDPLDGTREFIAGRDEFTVNIALIAAGRPIAGVIAAPALGIAWRGAAGHPAERVSADPAIAKRIRTRPWPATRPHALASRSHGDPATAALLEGIGASVEVMGSALKFCRLAEGAADLYPRLAPTSEWDIAAGDALLSAAGGAIVSPQGEPLRYGQQDCGFRVPGFIATGDPPVLFRLLGETRSKPHPRG